MPEVELSTGSIYYEIHGQGEPLIGLHYGMGSTKSWKGQIQAFCNSCTFIIYDRLGHGRSEQSLLYKDGYLDDRASELGELIEHLGFDSVHLCGVCEGGAVGLLLASRFPDKVKTLILQSVGYHGTDQTIAACERYFRSWDELEPNLRHNLAANHGPDYAKAKWEAVRQARYYVWSRAYDLRPQFAQVQAPTLIMGGDRDQFFGIDHPITAYKGIAGSRLCILPKTGHFANEQSPHLFNTVVLDFLKAQVTAQ